MPAFGEPVVHQLKVVAGVEVHRAGRQRRRRLAGDQIEPPIGRQQELASVVNVQPDPRVAQRRSIRRVDGVAHRDDVRRDLGDVDRLDGLQLA